MQDRVKSDIGASELEGTDWNAIEWAAVNRKVKNLRQRIYRATQEGQWNKVRSLKKLMMCSHSNRLLSIRKVTQENHGKRTPGVDGRIATTPEERGQLIQEMQKYEPWHVKPTRRVYIPKANGKQRPLGIATIKDRIAQAMVKNAIEPEWEVKFEGNSYGFRPGRNCQDAIEYAWGRLNTNGGHNWILDADIQGAFDNIYHSYILKAIGQTPGRRWIEHWLKAGYIEAESFHPTESGVPQGGVVSPVLANIALDGMERLLAQHEKVHEYVAKSGPKVGRVIRKRKSIYGFARYADDFIVTAEMKEELEAILPEISTWLAERGLQLNPDKTHIRHITEGFNFLGFNIRRYGHKTLTKPQKEKVHAKVREIKDWLYAHQNIEPQTVIQVLNPILRGWANYYKHGVSKEVFATFDHYMVQALIRWAKRRHPSKGIRWVIPRYFGTVGNDNWVFQAKGKDRRGQPHTYSLYRMAQTEIVRHVKVRGTASPDDPTLNAYWEKRRTKYGRTYYVPGSKLYRVAERQRWKCPICMEHLFKGEPIHIHHQQAVKLKGDDQEGNLCLLHVACHQIVHSKNTFLCRELEPYDG